MTSKTNTRSTTQAEGGSDLRRIVREEMASLKDEIYEKIDDVRADLNEKIDNMQASFVSKVEDFKNEIMTEMNQKLDDLTKECNVLNDEVRFLKIQNNVREQRDRDKGLRLFNLKVPESVKKSPVSLANHLYKEVLQDMMLEAEKDGLIEKIPCPLEIIEYTHVLPNNVKPRAPSQSPPEPVIIMKLSSRSWKSIIYKYKRTSLSKYNTAHSCNVHILDDMTKINLKCLSRLKDMKNDVKSAFMLGGKIRFELFSKPETLLMVHDPFATTISNMTKRMNIPE